MKQRIPFANFSWGQLLHAPWRALGDVWREVRWAWQRALYGYSDVDRWDLGPYLLGWLPAALREFADNCEAHPESMPMEAWTAKLRRVADGLDALARWYAWQFVGDGTPLKEQGEEAMHELADIVHTLWD